MMFPNTYDEEYLCEYFRTLAISIPEPLIQKALEYKGNFRKAYDQGFFDLYETLDTRINTGLNISIPGINPRLMPDDSLFSSDNEITKINAAFSLTLSMAYQLGIREAGLLILQKINLPNTVN